MMKGKGYFTIVIIAVLLGVLFFPVSGEAIASEEQFYMDVRDADIRDVLSAIAIKTNTKIVFLEEPTKITFAVEHVTPMKALELLLQKEGLGYIRDGKLLVVGRQDNLDTNYFADLTITRFDLVYIRTEQFEPILSTLGLPIKTFVFDTNPNAIWVEGAPEHLAKIKDLLGAVDMLENAIYPGGEIEALALPYREIYTYAVEPERLVDMVKNIGVPLERYITLGNRMIVFDKDVLDQWEEFYQIMHDLDTLDARESSVFLYRFNHIAAQDGANRLATLGHNGVRTILYHFPEMSKDLIIISPPELEAQVYSDLTTIDTPAAKIKAPIMSAQGEYARRELQAKRNLLAEMTSVRKADMYISDNISGNPNNPHYVLWAHETPEKIKMLQDLIHSF